MPDFKQMFNKEVFNKYKEKWDGFDKFQKIRIILSVVIVLGSVIVATFLVTRPNYQSLVSGNASDIGEMSASLTDAAIGHKLANGGTSILVKAKDKDSAQIVLSQSGYLGDSVKLEDSLNLMTFSTTESDKKKIYKEYYETKISAKLVKMDSIIEAIVNLSIPEKSIFSTEDADAPTASVMVTPEKPLTQPQLKGIASLVASSVEGLKVENVTIVDNTGTVLNEKTETNIMNGLSTTNMEIQANKKKEVETQVKMLLSDLSDSVKVMAQVVCDFDQEVTSSVTYSSPIEDSDTGMLRSQQINKINSQTTTNGTIVGADSNQGAGALNGTGTTSSENSQSINSEYELNQVNKDIVKALGNIDPERSSITVNLLYGNKFAESPISTDEARETVVKMVANATGINQNRITVTSFKMAVSEDSNGISGYSILLLIENSAPYIAAVIIIGIVMIFILRIKASFEDKELEEAALLGANIDIAVGEDDSIKELDNTSELKQQINAFIDKQPDVAAGMLRNWIYENDK